MITDNVVYRTIDVPAATITLLTAAAIRKWYEQIIFVAGITHQSFTLINRYRTIFTIQLKM